MAGIALNSFVNHFRDVGIRTTIMYQLEANSPIAEVNSFLKNLNLYADSWQAPKRNVEYKDVHFRAYPLPVPTTVKNDQKHTFTCIADTLGYARNAFLIWMNSVVDADFAAGSYFGGNKRFPTTSSIRLHLLSDDMSTINQTILISGVNIVDVGELKMSNNSADICTFSVTLNSLYWNYEGGEGTGALTTGF